MKKFFSIFHDSAEPDSPYSWKRVACSIFIFLIFAVSITGLALMAVYSDGDKTKWIGATSATLVALFIVAILVLMGYAASIEKAISAARGNK